MLCESLYRQRCTIELIADLDMNNFEAMEQYLIAFLKELSKTLNMKIFMGPFVGLDKDEATGENGPSAFIGWTTSGCQVHVWPFRHFVSVDIYSCKAYVVSDALEIIERYFRPTEIEVF